MDHITALNEAVAIAGGMPQLAAKIGAPSAYAVKQWKQTAIPARYCPAIEKVTGVVCERLLPSVDWSVLRQKPAIDGTSIAPDAIETVAIPRLFHRADGTLTTGERAGDQEPAATNTVAGV